MDSELLHLIFISGWPIVGALGLVLAYFLARYSRYLTHIERCLESKPKPDPKSDLKNPPPGAPSEAVTGNPMSNQPPPPQDFLKAIFEQHWLQARQVGNERLWLMNIYAIILAGALTFMKDYLFCTDNIPVVIFLMVFSLFCILFSIKMDYVLKAHTNYADMILKEHKLPVMLKFPPHWVNSRIRISRFFPMVYSLCFCLLLYILLKILHCSNVWSILIPLVILLPVWIWIYGHLGYDRFENR
jgi:hypothetical protein